MAVNLFEKVATELDFPKEEREILEFWKRDRIFEKSLEKPAPEGDFVFYEGPPTANGMPHNGHVLTRVIKDLFPRYKTMRGYRVARKAGWDTHGLPVEVEVEKELHIHGKAAIEAYGIEPFSRKCIESVFRYTEEWEKLTERIGFWVDLGQAYVTFHRSYVESVWWALSELFKKGLLYKSHKVVWWWAQGGTALSSGEVGQGYKTVDDPSVYVAFPLTTGPHAGAALLVWTTTPWTLPSNTYAAVQSGFEYVVATFGEGADLPRYVLARALVPELEKRLKSKAAIAATCTGAELVGSRYEAPFDTYQSKLGAGDTPYFRVVAADFVTLDSGTGIVHLAPAFGEDDFNAHRKIVADFVRSRQDAGGSAGEPPLLNAVKPDGTFSSDLPRYEGRWVKACDKELQEELKAKHRLVFAELYRHEYPFCWRADSDPLIQYARPAWYIRTTEKIHEAIANNQSVSWYPGHIKDGRFGEFLANNVDWALSRERYWGTPLNVWVNDVTGAMEAPSSVAEIREKNPDAFRHFDLARAEDPALSEHLMVHKPWIDAVTWEKKGEPGVYRRVPDVIDCWFDSGCMPFAQWGFPHQGTDEFKRSFPADFISEAIDQTRGWFYSLLMIATLVFDEETQARYGLTPAKKYPLPFQHCIVLGHVSDKEGKKESKSKGNYTPPDIIFDRVQMEFAVWDASSLAKAVKPPAHPEDEWALIALEDLEGLDLQDGAKVRICGEGERELAVALYGRKGIPRRVVVLSPALRVRLGVEPAVPPEVKAADVSRLPTSMRVRVEDPASPAPGADAFRWFFYASNPPWSATRHSLTNVRLFQKETLIKLRNVYSFFTIYGNIDGFNPWRAPDGAQMSATGHEVRGGPGGSSGELDAWIEALRDDTVRNAGASLDAFDIYGATIHLADFVDALSNWYLRRSRARFWRSGTAAEDADKDRAYRTLYGCLVTAAALFAPFTPFLAESMYQNLVRGPAARSGVEVPESVHLLEYPVAAHGTSPERAALLRAMAETRALVSLGLQVRTQAKLKVRQPLRSAKVLVPSGVSRDTVRAHETMIKDELNVLGIELVAEDRVREFVEIKLKPNFRTLGARGLGKEAQALKKAFASAPAEKGAEWYAALGAAGSIEVDGVTLRSDDVEVAFETRPGFAAAGDRVGVVVLETTLDDELRELGFVRELQNRVQACRKEMGLEFTDRIRLVVASASPRVGRIVGAHAAEIGREVLASAVGFGPLGPGLHAFELEVEGEPVTIGVQREAPR